MKKIVITLLSIVFIIACSGSDDSSEMDGENVTDEGMSSSDEKQYTITPVDWIQGKWIEEEQSENDEIIEFSDDDIIFTQNNDTNFINSRKEFYTATYVNYPDYADLVDFEVKNESTEDSYRFRTFLQGNVNEDYYFIKDTEDPNSIIRMTIVSNSDVRENKYIKLE